MKASSITRKHSGQLRTISKFEFRCAQWNAVISVCLDARIVILALQPYLHFGIVGNDAEFFFVCTTCMIAL